MNKASDCTCAEPLGSRSGDACLTTFPTLDSIITSRCADRTKNTRRRIRIGVYCVPSDSRRSRRWPISTPALSITALACRRLSLLVTRLLLQHTLHRRRYERESPEGICRAVDQANARELVPAWRRQVLRISSGLCRRGGHCLVIGKAAM